MPGELISVNPNEMVPPAASKMWPEMLPIHGITIIAGIRPEGREAVHVIHNTDAPLWVLIGLLDSVRQDLLNMWQTENYAGDEEEEA